MRTPWQWLLDRAGITAKIKKLETKSYTPKIRCASGTCGMVSDSLGEFVKYKALETLFLDSR
jgi:hypothetical protein